MTREKNKEEIDGQTYIIEAKDLTFFDVQAVAPLLAQSSLDFSSYWRYAFTNWLDFYDVETECAEYPNVDRISPEVGQRLASLLPEPAQVMEWLVFREAKSVALGSSSMDDQATTDFATNEKGWSTF